MGMGNRACGRRPGRHGMVVVGAVLATITMTVPSAASPSADDDSWHVAATLGLGTEDTAVSCWTAQSCLALEAGELLTTEDAGKSWSTLTKLVPAGIAALEDLDCAPGGSCFVTAIGADGSSSVLRWDEGSFTPLAVPATNPLPSIVCAGSGDCIATDGTSVIVTRDGGETWKTHPLDQIIYTVPALACADRIRSCWVVGDRGEIPLIEASGHYGRGWHSQVAPAKADGLYDISCPSITSCYAVGADVNNNALAIRTTDGGQTWHRSHTPKQDTALRSVSCADSSTCWASGPGPGDDPFLFTLQGTKEWTRQDFGVGHSGGTPELDCRAAPACVAVSGGLAFSTSDSGTTWQSVGVPAGLSTPQSLACASATFCVAVADDALGRPAALTSDDLGSTWNRHDLPKAAAQLHAVDCPTTTICFALSSGTAADPTAQVAHALSSADGGQTWQFGSVSDKQLTLRYLSCPAPTTCLAAGYDRHSAAALLLTTDGMSWQRIDAPPGAFYVDGVACSKVTSCVVVAQAIGQDPVAWTTSDLGGGYQPHQIPVADYYDLSCAARGCVAVGSDGGSGAISISHDFGATWRARKVPAEAQILGSVSCGIYIACAATGFDFSQDGGPLVVGSTNEYRSWTAYPVPAGRQQPIDIACPGSLCIASGVSVYGNPLILEGSA